MFGIVTRLLPAVRRVADAKAFRLDALRVVRAASSLIDNQPAPSLVEMCAA